MEYKEEDFLMLSGIQHFKFCRRQWALIHVENQWEDNYRTTDGRIIHEKAHDYNYMESRGDIIVTRGLKVFSRTMGISGQCDIVEFHRSEEGVELSSRTGLWIPYPVEYKRGNPKKGTEDLLQLCAQAMCLEEMLLCKIQQGALYYKEPHQRLTVAFTEQLREEVQSLFFEMHDLYKKNHTPKVKATTKCNACSLKDKCLPRLMKKKDVANYIISAFEDKP